MARSGILPGIRQVLRSFCERCPSRKLTPIIARQERPFVERLLFTAEKAPFRIDRPSIKLLHTNGLLKKDEEGNVAFWAPFYKKRLYDAFYPYTNGEKTGILPQTISTTRTS